ncbi:MAG: serine/threonine protein phosphatase [Treponema sp.]|nr:serine/threonine protein phosphatase [Treponema sp.]
MASSFFSDIISKHFNPDAVLDLTESGNGGNGKKVLIISDFHMGSGKHDDLHPNGELVRKILEEYYYPNGWYLVLNGDIEELAKFTLPDIRTEWAKMYRVFDLFAASGRLYKTLGNHDEDLIFERNYPYPLYNVVRIETGPVSIYVFHGHQSSAVYTVFNNLVRLSIKYLFKPFGIRNISSARSPHRRFHVERRAYEFSLRNNCVSVIGHTHRALFESLGRFDYIKFEIERLCRDYPSSNGEERERIAEEVWHLREELGKLKRSERREGLKEGLYGDELPVPCVFNSGCAIGKKGVNAIEVDNENIALVYWFAEGKGMKFISRGGYNVEMNAGFCRAVLNQDRLDYVKAKIELFSGREPDNSVIKK